MINYSDNDIDILQKNYIEKNKKYKNGNEKLVEYMLELNPCNIDIQPNSNDNDKLILTRLEPLSSNKSRSISGNTIANIIMCACKFSAITDIIFENWRTVEAIRCKNRFCPFCSKQKSRYYAMAIQIMYNNAKNENYEHLFLTLTAPNVEGEDLDEEIRHYYKAIDKLFKRKSLQFVQGYISKLEVTYNSQRDDYHPHFHILLAVKPSYFKDSKVYISRNKLLEIWKKCKNDDRITQLDIRRVKNKNDDVISSEVLELSKYIAKDSDYLHSVDVFSHYYNGLKGKRLFRFSGIYKKYKKMLENGQLDKDIDDNIEYYYKLDYKWDGEDYQRVDFRELSISERNNLILKKREQLKNEIKKDE